MLDVRVGMNRRSSLKLAFLPVALMAFGLFVATPVVGQVKKQPSVNRRVQSTPAYSEILLRETELRADVEVLMADYTDDYPKVRESRYALELIRKEKARLSSVDPEKMTTALGKIIIRKVDAEVELWRLQQGLADEHPNVKRAKRKVEIFEAAIREILG